MIIPNGTVEFKMKTPGGISPSTGLPVPSAAAWGTPVPCQFIPASVNLQARTLQGNPAIRASFTILINRIRPLCGEQIRLKDLAGHTVGEYPVISAEPLRAVQQIRIIV